VVATTVLNHFRELTDRIQVPTVFVVIGGKAIVAGDGGTTGPITTRNVIRAIRSNLPSGLICLIQDLANCNVAASSKVTAKITLECEVTVSYHPL
jgi:hypothetical protein